MFALGTCVETSRLRAHLEGLLNESDQRELIAHLDTCQTCQRMLEQLASGGESLLEMAREVGRETLPRSPRLGQLLGTLQRANMLSAPDLEPADSIALDFLDPPQGEMHLGRLAHYEVTQVIARGGMGIVLKARDEKLERDICLKVLAPQFAASEAARTRFLREARAAAAIRSEHVVTIHAVEEHRQRPYLVLEYVPGGSLQERVDRGGPLPLDEVVRIGLEVAKGLAAAHAQGFVHRDVKPGNILLEEETGKVKITDFGLARAVDDASLSREGIVAGTPEYMSPEQARGQSIDHRTDLFSLGSVLYAMCTGRSPFAAEGTLAILKRICQDTPQDVRELRPDVPADLAELIARLHRKQTADRPQSAEEVRALLARCGGSAAAIGPALTVSRRQWLAAAGAAATVGGLLFCAGRWRQHSAAPEPAPSTDLATSQTSLPTAAATRRWPPRVLLVIASRDFFYPDYYSVRVQLEMYGVVCRVASTTLEECAPIALGPHMPVKPDLLLVDARGADYEVVYFCGGRGSLEYADDGKSAQVARRVIGEALAAQRTVAAMSSGVVVLAEADVLRGRQAACNPYGDPPGVYVHRIEARGVVCSEQAVVEDGPFLTGRAPQDVQAFIRTLQKRLGIEPRSRSLPPPSD